MKLKPASHYEFLVEEPSAEAFLRSWLPRALPVGVSFEVHAHQGKDDLQKKLTSRLRGYASWLPEDWRLVVLLDRDDDRCELLKKELESCCLEAGLRSRSVANRSRSKSWHVVNRIAVEELEAWFFGDWQAVMELYPRVSDSIPRSRGYRDCDGIKGGTWEALERVLQRAGYFESGLRKIELARAMGLSMSSSRCRSPSFQSLFQALSEGCHTDLRA
jgi:hypothetical protein